MKEKIYKALFTSDAEPNQISIENAAGQEMGDKLYYWGYFIALAGIVTTLVGRVVEERYRVRGSVDQFIDAMNKESKKEETKEPEATE